MEKIIHQFLAKHRFSTLNSEFDDNYESHPNYPSLFAITDTFSLLQIENVAATVPKDQFDQLPICFLGYVRNDDGAELALIEQNKNEVVLTFNSQKGRSLSVDAFKELWNGVIIAIEPNINKVGDRPSTFINTIGFLFLGIFMLFFLKQGMQFSLTSMMSYAFYNIGFVLSVFIIQEKLDSSQGNIAKLCSLSEKISCDSVVRSNVAKINEWLDFSDLPILFFSTSLLSILIDPSTDVYINFISLLSLPILIYSIWLQKVKLKKWCVLCLSISLLVTLQAILLFKTGFSFQSNVISLLVAAVITVPLWFFIKNYLEHNAGLEKQNKALKRFKRNYNVFNLLQQPLQYSLEDANFSKIQIGNDSNPITISLILSPSCGHCHSVFEEAIKICNSNKEKIQLSIFYNLNPENKGNPYLEVAKSILQINRKNPEALLEALSDWHIKRMGLTDWLFAWEETKIDDEVLRDLKSQYEWCLMNDFNYTPVNIINQKGYPKEYDLSELNYFISELYEETKPLVMV